MSGMEPTAGIMETAADIDVALLSEIVREVTPYRVMFEHQRGKVSDLLADQLPHESWYFDAWIIATAYRLISSHATRSAIEQALLRLHFSESADETKQ